MSYTINKLGASDITVEYGTLNTETSLQLVGKDYFGYGEAIAQNFVDLLENFATDDTANGPASPIAGQLWYHSSADTLKVYDGVKWSGTTFNQESIKDNGSVMHDVFVVKANNVPVATFSSDTGFIVHADETEYHGSAPDYKFPNNRIEKGLTLGKDMKMHGTATTAEYADLAELYTSDAEYEAGTVVKIGGEAEVTQTTIEYCPEVFGVVSTNPAYLMNSAAEGLTVPVALEGRVPCKVMGEVHKGQRLISSNEPGVARAVSDYEKEVGMDWFRVVGRALENKDTLGIGLVEIVVGVK
tara:strand:+ start:295 stop:1191 length:897 start_codon:yes stop_codon:yes gene_type:complete